jgi:hypothetical protein
MPGDTPVRRLARWAWNHGADVAIVDQPVPLWRRSSSTSPLGEYLRPRWYSLQPRTWYPLEAHQPWNGNMAWNGGEFFTRPRAGELLREAGFIHCSGLVLEHWSFVPLVRSFQAERFVVILSRSNYPGRKAPKVVRERFQEVLEDADVLHVQQGLEARLSLMVIPPVYRILEAGELGTEEHWFSLLSGGEQ